MSVLLKSVLIGAMALLAIILGFIIGGAPFRTIALIAYLAFLAGLVFTKLYVDALREARRRREEKEQAEKKLPIEEFTGEISGPPSIN